MKRDFATRASADQKRCVSDRLRFRLGEINEVHSQGSLHMATQARCAAEHSGGLERGGRWAGAAAAALGNKASRVTKRQLTELLGSNHGHK